MLGWGELLEAVIIFQDHHFKLRKQAELTS